jgi:hypothetical protein
MSTCAKFGNDHSPQEMRENANTSSYFPSLLYSCSPIGPKRLDRFLRLMAQNAWSGVRKCHLYDRTISDESEFQGSLSPKNYPNSPPDSEIPAKFDISNYHCNFLPT